MCTSWLILGIVKSGVIFAVQRRVSLIPGLVGPEREIAAVWGYFCLHQARFEDCEVDANYCCVRAVLLNPRLGWGIVKLRAIAAVWGSLYTTRLDCGFIKLRAIATV